MEDVSYHSNLLSLLIQVILTDGQRVNPDEPSAVVITQSRQERMKVLANLYRMSVDMYRLLISDIAPRIRGGFIVRSPLQVNFFKVDADWGISEAR